MKKTEKEVRESSAFQKKKAPQDQYLHRLRHQKQNCDTKLPDNSFQCAELYKILLNLFEIMLKCLQLYILFHVCVLV